MDRHPELGTYYRTIFPSKELFEVLGITEKREICFITQQDMRMRYQTFDTHEMFMEKIALLSPKAIDIGAIYNTRPLKLNGAVPVARELVFDIDLTDYPRTCCEGKKMCALCYEKIKCAVKILDYSLREEFGLRDIGFVFSGRRGVHCWVLEYKDLEQSVRSDIYKYFQYVIDKNLFVQEYHDIMREFADDDAQLVKDWFIRIDKQVTVAMTHLIKIPFSVHAETLNISIPLDPANIVPFEELPTLYDVVQDPGRMGPYVEILKRWKSRGD